MVGMAEACLDLFCRGWAVQHLLKLHVQVLHAAGLQLPGLLGAHPNTRSCPEGKMHQEQGWP